MKHQIYTNIVNLMNESDDFGGELVKLLSAVDELDHMAVLITQSVPSDESPNPIVHISVFTNKLTDFPADTEEAYKKWIIDFAEGIKEQKR